jgi:uncharacterized protein (TIGR02231 family)
MFLPGGTILAAEIDAAAPIGAVTVFPDRAEVTRMIEVTLPVGSNTVVIDDLPASLLPDSVRVEGQGADGVVIGSVETKSVYQEEIVSQQERRLQAEILALQDQQRAASDRIAAFQAQLNFIDSIGREMPATANDQIVRGAMDPAKWQEAWLALSSGVGEAKKGIQAAEIEMRDIDGKINQKSLELSQIRTGNMSTVVARINVESKESANVRLAFSYQLPDATWRPIYDARLETAEGAVELTQIGEVYQRTGEDWSGVDLTLSTARPSIGAVLPDLSPWFVTVADIGGREEDLRADQLPSSVSEAQKSQVILGGGAEFSQENGAGLDKEKELKNQLAQIVASEFAAEYRISGTATVPSDASPHKFVIAEHAMAADLAVRVVPKQVPLAHLYASLTYDGKDPLLPGPVALFRDGAFVGNSGLAMMRPKEKVELGFGVDDSVRVAYRLEDGEQSTSGIFTSSQRIERRFRIEIANHHDKPIDITVLDQLPVSQDERVTVELLNGSTRPTQADWQDRKGVYAWANQYEPGEERIIKFGYGVDYPEGAFVAGL